MGEHYFTLRRIFMVLLISIMPLYAWATVDFLSVNKITKEYYWGDEDRSPGWIGWEYVPEGQLDTAEGDLKKLGYTETFYPYKIETCLTVVVLGAVTLILLRKKLIVKEPKKSALAGSSNKYSCL